jgi:hypothetical protein
MRRSDQPRRLSAITCCCVVGSKTLLIAGNVPLETFRRATPQLARGGRFSVVHWWPDLGVHRGHSGLSEILETRPRRVCAHVSPDVPAGSGALVGSPSQWAPSKRLRSTSRTKTSTFSASTGGFHPITGASGSRSRSLHRTVTKRPGWTRDNRNSALNTPKLIKSVKRVRAEGPATVRTFPTLFRDGPSMGSKTENPLFEHYRSGRDVLPT